MEAFRGSRRIPPRRGSEPEAVLGHSGAVLGLLGPSGATLGHLGHLGLSWAVWMRSGPSGVSWGLLGPAGANLGHLGLVGAIWGQSGPFGVNLAPSGPSGAHSAIQKAICMISCLRHRVAYIRTYVSMYIRTCICTSVYRHRHIDT